MLDSYLLGVGAVFALMTLVWLASLRLRDASIIDSFWGPGFALAAWVYHLTSPGISEPRQLLVLVLVTIWALRLGIYIAWRNHGEDEDYRYQEMREKAGDSFWWSSLYRVFWLQAGLIALISLPLLWVVARPGAEGWLLTDWLGVGLWAVGFYFEAAGDWQMARFKADPSNQGKVMDRGVWGWSRHPNYFGDAAQWWGWYLLALAVPGGWWTLPSVVLMTFFLLKVSGVALLEKTIVDRRPKYKDYIENTSAFIPWPPKRRSESANR